VSIRLRPRDERSEPEQSVVRAVAVAGSRDATSAQRAPGCSAYSIT